MTADHRKLVARTPEEFWEKNRVRVLTRHRVEAIDPSGRTVRVTDLSSGSVFTDSYTRLLVSTGAHAFVPPMEGSDLEGCFTLRTLSDGIALKRFVIDRRPERAVIVGAGSIGMEMCEALRVLGVGVTLVELADQVAPFLDADMAGKVREKLEAENVRCLLGTTVKSFSAREGRLRGAETSAGDIDCDLALLSIGVRPSTGLAEAAGASLGSRGAIRVGADLSTSLPGVYAAGDCATTTNQVTGEETWLPLGSIARKQGRLAAGTMFGSDQKFPGVLGTAVVKCFDLTVGRTGLSESDCRKAGIEPVSTSMEAESLHEYYPGGGMMSIKLTADGSSGRLVGAQLVGDLAALPERRLDVFATAIASGMTAGDAQYLDLAYAPPYSTAVDPAIIAGNLLFSSLEGKECSCGPHGLE